MSPDAAPWLQGLEDEDSDWPVPIEIPSFNYISSASHDAAAIPSRIPVRSSTGSLKTSSQASTQKLRKPLTALSSNDSNSLRRSETSRKLSQTRSFSGGSDGSVVQYDTVQQRSKSASPVKQETLEWKKRLVRGQVGYGDQTDLFGATGLENIFAQTRSAANTPKQRGNVSWLQKSAEAALPSSPPIWRNRVDESAEWNHEESTFGEGRLPAVDEEDRTVDESAQTDDSSSSATQSPSRQASVNEDDAKAGEEEQQESSPHRPALDYTQDNMEGNRTASGQTDVDDFSPVFVSKHTSTNGNVEYKALDSRAVQQFQSTPVDLQPEGQTSPVPLPHEPEFVSLEESDTFTDVSPSESLPAIPDLSLSENLPTGTPPVASLGDRVQLKRGGYSQNGSFKLRPLSSSQSTAVESVARRPSSLLSPSAAGGRGKPESISQPATPGQTGPLEPRTRSSGSPLKLFGPHDTFTTNRLWRRMSQLDPSISRTEAGGAIKMPNVRRHNSTTNMSTRSVSEGSFGSGELNNHPFNAEITITSASDSDRDRSEGSPGSEIPAPGSKNPLTFRLGDSTLPHDTFKLKRKLSKRSEMGSKDSTLNTSVRALQPTVEDVSDSVIVSTSKGTGREHSNNSTSKRPPNSPFKAPTPKRRRTLHATELRNDVAEMSRSYRSQLQGAMGDRKRRESRRGDDREPAEPEVLSKRKILRPRNPTPNCNRREQVEAEIRETAEQFAAEEPEALEAVMEQIELSMASDSPPSIQRQANVVANEVAKFSLRIQKASGDHGERKRSVTTQDFFNEAVMVMRLIREKAGRQSGLGSVAESEQETSGQALKEDYSDQDLSSLRVSRPPSREGISGWRPRTSEQTDPRVISHLRRFEETNDTDFIAESALQMEDEGQDVVVDEHSNIRIRGPLVSHSQRGEEDGSRPSTQHSQKDSIASQSTQNSAASSTGRTLLSRKSDNVGTLAPEHVAHLIGEQVGAMTYDKDKQQWVKVKSPQKWHQGSFLEPPSNITSDDDPLREISDLPVDERKEAEIRNVGSTRRKISPSSQSPYSEGQPGAPPQNADPPRTTSRETVLARPTAGGSVQSRHTYSSSDPSRHTAFASSQHQTIETRATSWGNEELEGFPPHRFTKQQPPLHAAAQAFQNRIHEIEDEPRVTRPDANNEEDCSEQERLQETELSAGLREDTAVQDGEDDIEDIESPRLRQSLRPQPQVISSPVYRSGNRQASLRRKTLTSKLKEADIVEQSELSFVASLPGERMMSVSLSVSRPLSQRRPIGHVTSLQPSPSKSDPSFILSDLPEFTVHEEDYERPSERALANRLAQYAADEVSDRYTLAVKDLVKTLADVKEDEPYWEDLRQIDLHDRSLASIHGLRHFCGSIQEMDLSENKLQYLDGAPVSVRQLVVRSNLLSSLTSWTHLTNLQYLDISDNKLHSLDALNCLIHLRDLRIDDNELTNLDGLMQLDGLLKLRARRNKLRAVDFSQSQLQRLEELDLCENSIEFVENLEMLPALKSLKLDGNLLATSLQPASEMWNLKYVSLKNCGLQYLNVSAMPYVRELILDDNALPTIPGIEALRSLDVLSMRRQSLTDGTGITVLQRPVHARKIRLSENNIPLLHLNNSLLSVQHLELASVGLQELPGDFGLLLPNLTTLNLNYNGLRDIRPLLNIQNIEKLSVCGNRLDRLRKTIATVSRLASLRSIDFRNNPVTQAFYPPLALDQQPLTSVVRRQPSPASEDEDDRCERVEATKHTMQAGSVEQDRIHQTRLDDETKLRRRVYHLLLGNSCEGLEEVDGLAFDKIGAKRRDETWERLLALGIVRKSGAVGMKAMEKSP